MQNNEKTYFLDMFSGIGGFALAAYWAGLRFDGHYFSEINKWAVELYQKRFPNAIALGDITEVDYGKLPKGKWLITGGFPCQPHSIAGKRKASKDKRDLWPECSRALSSLRPEIALFENVPGVLISDGGRFFNQILSDISESGHAAEWQIISAAEVGAKHKRERVWIVAYSIGKRYLEAEQSLKRLQNLSKKNKNIRKEWGLLRSISAGAYTLRNWEAYEQILTGNYDGIPGELDGIEGAGNAIVPQCAEMIMNLPAFDLWRAVE